MAFRYPDYRTKDRQVYDLERTESKSEIHTREGHFGVAKTGLERSHFDGKKDCRKQQLVAGGTEVDFDMDLDTAGPLEAVVVRMEPHLVAVEAGGSFQLCADTCTISR